MEFQQQYPELWSRQIERRLYELGALIKGNLPIQAERIADVVEQINDLRNELKAVTERQEKMARWLKQNCSKCNGGPHE